MENLTIEDIDLLNKALDAYKNKFQQDAMMGLMFEGLLSKKEDKDQFEHTVDVRLEKANAEKEAAEENIVLIKAKLITMKKQLAVSEMSEILRTG